MRDIAQLHQTFLRVVLEQTTLTGILENLNEYVYREYSGKRSFTCILARWEGDLLEYANAGHLPALHLHKEGRTRLDTTCGPLGEREDAQFSSTSVPFPPRDLLMLFTDGLFAKLTSDREQGIAEVEGLAERFSHGEVNTICHRVFDCAQPGLEEATDDSTLVVVRRQPRAAEESKAKSSES
jgi:serine phosphatase RsbU (regulator of sigma subunit)